ncbi:hypothetical protein L7F22_055247 [Adiantum nelumboides]|nr:hypothetical protein [Adiantum nelumboides]
MHMLVQEIADATTSLCRLLVVEGEIELYLKLFDMFLGMEIAIGSNAIVKLGKKPGVQGTFPVGYSQDFKGPNAKRITTGCSVVIARRRRYVGEGHSEDWEGIVKNAHEVSSLDVHRGVSATLDALKLEWCTDSHRHGIPIAYIKAYVDSCGCVSKPNRHVSKGSQNRFDLNKPCVTIPSIKRDNVDDYLTNVMIEHKVCLVMARSSKKHTPLKVTVDYLCHRGSAPKRCGKEVKRSRTSKKCGCPFKIQLEYVEGSDDVHIIMKPFHEGHVAGSRSDLYHLPVHPHVIQCCIDDLFDVGSSRHVAQMSMSKERIHMMKASILDRTIFIFFMIPKEIAMLSYQVRIQDRVTKDDWATMYAEALALQKQHKVLYVQPYNPNATDPKRRPFILVIQDEWMLEIALRFSQNNSWAIDSTFKTNAFGLPLFAAVLPNQLGVGIPIWFMFCTVDAGSHHEVIALELTLRIVLSRMGSIRPTALVIDKSHKELEAILNVVQEDPHCWVPKENGGQSQIACHILLCWFHTKKAWVENLLPQIAEKIRGEVYVEMTNLMHSATKEDFMDRYRLLLQKYAHNQVITRYVTNGWCGENCMWRERWPKFGRLFNHGNVDTTNLVERLWRYIKYTLLEARINRSLVDLLHALVGDSKTGNRMGGTLVRFFKQKQEIADSGRFIMAGSSKRHTARLKEGEKLAQRYKDDPTTLLVMDEMLLHFQIQSSTTLDKWFHVRLQSNYCNCLDWSSECKHLYGTRLIVMQHFSHLNAILPIVDNIHEMMGLENKCGLDNEPIQEEVEKESTCFTEIQEILSTIQEGLPNKSHKEKEIIMHQVETARDILRSLVAPSQIDMPCRGSVRQIQEHVTQTRLGHGQSKKSEEFLEHCDQPHKPPRQTGVLRRKHQRGRSRVRLEKRPRIWCPHCCTKTLYVDPTTTTSCHTCHALLPLTKRHCPSAIETFLVGREARVCDGSHSFLCHIVAIEYPPLQDEERSFSLNAEGIGNTITVQASTTRIVLAYYKEHYPIQFSFI